MELAEVKVGETYLYTNDEDTSSGQTVFVTGIDANPEYEYIWPIEATFPDGENGLFWAHELSRVV